MGLLDQVLGNVLGSRQGGPSATGGATSMSPMMKALMLFLAVKAYQQYRSRQASGAGIPGGLPTGQSTQPGGQPAGSGGLGGLLAGLGGLAGAGGLGALVEHFARQGQGDAMSSWIGTGPNQQIAPKQLLDTLGTDTIDALAQQTGMPRDQVLTELSNELPKAVDQLTPSGRLPSEQELNRMLQT